MYNIRTNILLDEKTHNLLKQLALQKNTSIGELVREAIKHYYIDSKIKNRLLVKEKIEKYRVIRQGKIDYKKFKEEGRKN